MWNINGVKDKFSLDDTNNIFKRFDIIIIAETHFKIRVRCPVKFHLIGKSKCVESRKARGGVAVYKIIFLNLI